MYTRSELRAELQNLSDTDTLSNDVDYDVRVFVTLIDAGGDPVPWMYGNTWAALPNAIQEAILFYNLVQTHTDPDTGLELPNGVGRC